MLETKNIREALKRPQDTTLPTPMMKGIAVTVAARTVKPSRWRRQITKINTASAAPWTAMTGIQPTSMNRATITMTLNTAATAIIRSIWLQASERMSPREREGSWSEGMPGDCMGTITERDRTVHRRRKVANSLKIARVFRAGAYRRKKAPLWVEPFSYPCQVLPETFSVQVMQKAAILFPSRSRK